MVWASTLRMLPLLLLLLLLLHRPGPGQAEWRPAAAAGADAGKAHTTRRAVAQRRLSLQLAFIPKGLGHPHVRVVLQ